MAAHISSPPRPPRRSFTALPSSSYSALVDALSRKSLSYGKLPEEPLKLSVLKLDGSSFDIQVAKTAKVAELKLAVEAVFGDLPQKGPGKISWPHVWGHFCLCYDGQKLATDSEYLRDFGIKDGDQLCFTRHVSISYNLIKKRPAGRRIVASQPKNLNETGRSNGNGNGNGKLGRYADQGCLVGRGGGPARLRRVLGKWRAGRGSVGSKTETGLAGGLKKAVVRCCCKIWHRRRSDSLGNATVSSSKRYLVNK